VTRAESVEPLGGFALFALPPHTAPDAAQPQAPTVHQCRPRFEKEALGVVLAFLESKTDTVFCYEEWGHVGHASDSLPVFATPVTLTINPAKPWEALDALSEATGVFVWQRDSDVVNIISTQCLAIKAYPLNRMVVHARFAGSWPELVDQFRGLRRKFMPRVGAAEGTRPPEKQALPEWQAEVQVEGVTLRSFLNRATRATGGYWVSVYREEYGDYEIYFNRTPQAIQVATERPDTGATPTLEFEWADPPAYVPPRPRPEHVASGQWAKERAREQKVRVLTWAGIAGAVVALGVLVARLGRRRRRKPPPLPASPSRVNGSHADGGEDG
jgi:hypothetical protein